MIKDITHNTRQFTIQDYRREFSKSREILNNEFVEHNKNFIFGACTERGVRDLYVPKSAAEGYIYYRCYHVEGRSVFVSIDKIKGIPKNWVTLGEIPPKDDCGYIRWLAASSSAFMRQLFGNQIWNYKDYKRTYKGNKSYDENA